ncbi:hypothetical protein M8C21_027511, partial [Ambrosia artemisiifolia]
MATNPLSAVAANPKPSLLRRPITHFRHHHLLLPNTSKTNLHIHRPLLLPPRVFTVDVSGHLLQDAGASLLVVSGAYALVSGFDTLTHHQIVEQNLSRKLVHILSGLLYMGCWPIF